MSRKNQRFNAQRHLVDAVADLANANGISKSEVINRAIAAFLDRFKEAIVALSDNRPVTSSTFSVGYMLDSLLLSKMDEQAAKLYLSREQFLRLALDYYLKYYDPDQTDEHKLAR